MSDELAQRVRAAAAALRMAGAQEVFVFGSATRDAKASPSDLDLAVTGLPPALFYRAGARVTELLGYDVDLVDLDCPTPFTRYLREENELVRVG